MDRADKIGTGVSAVLHLGVIAWVLLGGSWFKPKPSEPVVMQEVSVISEAEFSAMVAAAPKASETPVAEMPAQPQPQPVEQPAPEEAPAPEPQPQPMPEPVAEPEPQPDLSDLEPVEPAEVTEVPPSMMPPVEVPQDTTTPDFSTRPVPKPAPRVAPKPAEAPAPDAKVSELAEPETRPEESAEPEQAVEEPQQEAAPPEATTEIVTEATETEEKARTSAPLSTPRPRAKPAKPAPAPNETAAVKPPATAPSEAKPATDAVNDALAEAMAEESQGTGGTGRAASGPPVTAGEKEALIVDVKACWNVGALSSEALRTTVTLRVAMNPDGKPDIRSIEMVGYEGGSDAAARQAYEAGRRAIVRCGSDGFPLPPEKYDHWREIEIVFNPEKMRMK
ncbi:cell envelope biogenesis protein TolA [Sedimentimonas flavescens]|uniref:cell envelope biogenesis protein TolA n=1 Tax=Sedimentimonas flavescens TaxID=2851012 RepID=UPI0021A60CDF|nr:cell envelope biogenesis protein TolA [Sedimentimonas flavescens]MCT2539380.1 cell envelope biogenesis protein TolA [Sedimentimonas flavescens]